ncbi:MAG TPA: alpha amylase C-terminal domain-containing protein [Propionibacteriaceae bacterium]|nr:alpha amylase C-terminal domain-containing protein [Propionibacteriaceae bacterium]
MGANLIADGATFRVWAPAATAICVVRDGIENYHPQEPDLLVKQPNSADWAGFFPNVEDGTKYRYFVVGPRGSGFKRDPWARELELAGYPNCDCIVRNPADYVWHDSAYSPPRLEDLVVYQLHIGVFYARDGQGRDIRKGRPAKLLDALDRVKYLADLGVTAIQPLPFVEFQGEWSLGYNGTDLFSPEMDYCLDPADLNPYLTKVNQHLARWGHSPLTAAQLAGQVNQLKAFVDICHLYGLAVIPDVVYNHAGGNLDPQSMDDFDFATDSEGRNNAYFSTAGWAGGKVFAFDKAAVRQFLTGNAKMFLEEYHVDGLRFDEVTVIDGNGGWGFCQELTQALHADWPQAILIAEYWGEYRRLAATQPPGGMGFDIAYSDGIRNSVRSALVQASHGAAEVVDLEPIGRELGRQLSEPFVWPSYNCLENHDLVLDADGDHRKPRVARLADPSDPRSWYARSRARVATGLLLTSPGIPMLFMGQEFLEDKLWSDNPNRDNLFLWWEGVEGADKHMVDFHQFTRDLIRLRRSQPALRGEAISVFNVDQANRVLAFQRWLAGAGRTVVVVVSLSESPFEAGSYQLGFPGSGTWFEVHNSDYYDNFPNRTVRGNNGSVQADGPPLHGFDASAGLTIPANSILMFARDHGD